MSLTLRRQLLAPKHTIRRFGRPVSRERRMTSTNVTQATETTAAAATPPPPSRDTTLETFRLSDGRDLGYKTYGSPTGRPAFYFHGSPSCRLEAEGYDAAGRKLNVRVIGVDRLGMGLSTFKRTATIADWPQDVLQLAQHLQLDTFHVFGGSGGGPFALACARFLPADVLLGTGVVAGMAPPEFGAGAASLDRQFAFFLNKYLPWPLLRWLLDVGLGNKARTASPQEWERTMDKYFKQLTQEEQDLVNNDPEEKRQQVECYREALRHGSDGAVLDAKLFLNPWGFRLEDINAKVRLWNGTKDFATPVEGARYQASLIPGAQLKEVEGASHVGVAYGREEEILSELMSL